MTATADQVLQLRRMTGELTATTYGDEMLQDIIESYPTLDENGEAPRISAVDSARPVTYVPYMDPLDKVPNQDWIPTYDLNAAAAQIWDEKAALVAQDFDFNADGSSFSRSQVYQQYSAAARKYQAKRKAGTIHLKPEPHRRNMGTIQGPNIQ